MKQSIINNIGREGNCPDVTIFTSLLGLFVSFLFVFFLFLFSFSFCLSAFLSRHHPDQISEGSEVSKVSLCVQIAKRLLVTHSARESIELPGQLKKHLLFPKPHFEQSELAIISWLMKHWVLQSSFLKTICATEGSFTSKHLKCHSKLCVCTSTCM